MSRFSAPGRIKVDELIAVYDGVLPEVDEILREKGITSELPEPVTPNGVEDLLVYASHGDPVLPEDLTTIGDTELGKLFSLFTNWTNYVQGLLTSAECTRDLFKAQIVTLREALIITYQEADEGLSDSKAKARVSLDNRYVGATSVYQKSVVMAKRLATRFEQFKRSEKVISREQTRRQTELESMLHEKHGGQSSPFNVRNRRPPSKGRFS